MALLLLITPITKEQTAQFVRWQNPPPYESHDLITDPTDPQELSEAIAYFMQPQIHCHALTFPNNELVGFATFGEDGQVHGGDYATPALDIGLGIRPDLTNQGKGIHFITQLIQFAQTTFHPPALRVTIAETNLRAQKVWLKAGFTQQHRFFNKNNGRFFLIFTKS